ncbi:sensor histidine kinase [Streptosporangium sandarakinum]|uniref:sensor histidine kinase n=1 Tax=Streptosporangium sandarakinum TaxID=1260955 RepID=UPI0033AF2573
MTVETTTGRTGRTAPAPPRGRTPLGPYGPPALLTDPMTWRAVPYLLVNMFYGLAFFGLLSFAVPAALALTVVGVGVPLLALLMVVWRALAMAERRLLRLAFGVVIADPYRPSAGGGPLRRWREMVVDPATWKDLLYLLLLPPIGFVELVVSVVLWTLGAVLLVAPLPPLFGGAPLKVTDGLLVDDWAKMLACPPAGLAVLVAALYATRGLAWLHALLGVALLGAGEKELLAARAAQLRTSRARGVDAAEAERRRIERDLHDGAQQRLLTVAIDLGRARERLDRDPREAEELLARAHEGAKAALAELRDLARGIHPAILTDRGLEAALSSLTARAPVPVRLSVELDGRPPAAVESIAYFVVSECLANVARHASATEASVRIGRLGERVVVEVRDDGAGGAAPRPGGGLAGLADRAATIDGVLTVDSPPGGPTTVRAELPCRW